MKKIEFFRHNIGAEEIARVTNVLQSLFLTTGEEVAEFEERLALFLGLPYTAAVTSCTAAMQLALLAAGVGEGDEVITTPLTFVGTSNSVIMAGGTPVFADVERDTGNIDPAAVERAITERTKAVMPVHLYGQMCDMERIREIADRHGLAVIEDSAHSLEAEWKGKKSGHYGDFACFSFYATKNITSGEGGAVSVKNEEQVDLLRKLRLHGLETSAADRYTGRFKQYDVGLFGWKYNMDNIHAAILVEQMKRVDALLERRREIYHRYSEALEGTDGIELHTTRPEALHACHLFTILVDPERRGRVMEGLQERGIGVSINFHPIHLMTYYRERFGYEPGMFPVAEEIGSRTISLPLYPKLTEEEITYVIDMVGESLRES